MSKASDEDRANEQVSFWIAHSQQPENERKSRNAAMLLIAGLIAFFGGGYLLILFTGGF